MGRLEKIFICIALGICSIIIIFFCPVSVTVQTTTTAVSLYGSNPQTTSYIQEKNCPIWNIGELSSRSSGTGYSQPLHYYTKTESPKINFGKLVLEIGVVLVVSFVLYLIAKQFIII